MLQLVWKTSDGDIVETYNMDTDTLTFLVDEIVSQLNDFLAEFSTVHNPGDQVELTLRYTGCINDIYRIKRDKTLSVRDKLKQICAVKVPFGDIYEIHDTRIPILQEYIEQMNPLGHLIHDIIKPYYDESILIHPTRT